MEEGIGIHPDSSNPSHVFDSSNSSECQPTDTPSDLQKVSSCSDPVTHSCSHQWAGGRENDVSCKSEEIGNGKTEACDESDADEEYLSASEGEEDDDEDDDKKLEEWAETLSDLSSDVNTPFPTEMTPTGEKTVLNSPEQSKEEKSPLDSDSGAKATPVSETYSSAEKTVRHEEPASTVPSSETCINSVPDEHGKISPEDTEELECAIADAMRGTDEEDESGEEGEDYKKPEEEKEGDSSESTDCEKSKDQQEEETERKRREEENALTKEELEKRKSEAVEVRMRGNDAFKNGQYAEAAELYTQALELCPLEYTEQRALIISNRAACCIREGDYEGAIKDSTKSIELNPTYIKALFRRANAYEKLEKLEEALKDHQRIIELDPSSSGSYEACMRLEKEINERNEKLKAEMLGKLKDLGNMVLRPLGLSTNNFQLQQDPSTGSYNIQFVQNPPTNGH